MGHSCGTLEAVLRAFRTRRPPKVTLRGCARRAFRTRLPPKVTRQVSKTSASYETSSKSHASSLQNERFVRDFLQKSRVKSPKRAFRTSLPPKLTCQSLQSEDFVRDFLQKSSGNIHRSTHTHTSRSPAKQIRELSPSKQYPLTRQSQCDSDIHLYHNSRPHDSLRLP